MADIFEEVEEGIRQEKWAERWKKYGIFAYLGAGLLLGGVALNEYMQHSKAQTLSKNARVLELAVTALDERDYTKAGDDLAQLTDSKAAIAPVAAHFLAQVRLDGNGDALAATDVLTQAAAKGDGPAQRLALIKAAYLQADTRTRLELQDMLGGLPDEPTAFGALATELLAAKAFEEGDTEYARTKFNELRFLANVPEGVMQRATQALAALPAAVVSDPLTAPTQEGAPVDPVPAGEETQQ